MSPLTPTQSFLVHKARNLVESDPAGLLRRRLNGATQLNTKARLDPATLTPGSRLAFLIMGGPDWPYLKIFTVTIVNQHTSRKFTADYTVEVLDPKDGETIFPAYMLPDSPLMHLPDGSIALVNDEERIHLPNNEQCSTYLLEAGPQAGPSEIITQQTAFELFNISKTSD